MINVINNRLWTAKRASSLHLYMRARCRDVTPLSVRRMFRAREVARENGFRDPPLAVEVSYTILAISMLSSFYAKHVTMAQAYQTHRGMHLLLL